MAFRKMAAVALMALMIFIGAVKGFHTHSFAGDAHAQHAFIHPHCTICEFNFAENAQVAEMIAIVSPVASKEFTFPEKLIGLASLFPVQLSGRAPPFILA